MKIDKAHGFQAGARIVTLLLAVAVLTSGFGLMAQADQGDGPGPSVIRIAYLPVVGREDTVKRYHPLTAHLNRVLDRPVQGVSFDSYDDMTLALARGDFEIAYLSPATYVSASNVADLEVVAIELDPQGQRGYYAHLISRAGGPVAKLSDGRGRTLAFTNMNSTSGFLAPVHYFLTALKEAPASFAGNIVFAGDHREVIKGVFEGKYDFGATDNQDLAWIMKEENIPEAAFNILWTSDLIPGAPVCVRSSLDPALKKEIQRALISFSSDQEGTKALLIGGFDAATDRDYQGVKAMYEFAL